MAQETDDTPQLEIDWLKTMAGALAAVTTAVLLSTLGAVGTLIGAALGSVAATVGSALYAQGLARSRHAVLKAQETALHKVGIAQAEVRRANRRQGDDAAVEAHLEHADESLDEARADLDESVTHDVAPTWGDRIRALPWQRVALFAAGTFAVVILAITGFEKVAGHSLSYFLGGSDSKQSTTFGGVTGNGGDGEPDKEQQQDNQDDDPTGSSTPSESMSSETPTEEPTEEPSATPTPTPTETPTATPTPAPTAPTPSVPLPSTPVPTP